MAGPNHRRNDCRKLARDWLLCPKALILGRVDTAACPGLPPRRLREAQTHSDRLQLMPRPLFRGRRAGLRRAPEGL
jgi:hypothetical protein